MALLSRHLCNEDFVSCKKVRMLSAINVLLDFCYGILCVKTCHLQTVTYIFGQHLFHLIHEVFHGFFSMVQWHVNLCNVVL